MNTRTTASRFSGSVPRGSYLVVSHIASDGSDPAAMGTIQEAYKGASARAVFRNADDIERFFDGFELLQPGLVDVPEWQRTEPESKPAEVRFVGSSGGNTDRGIEGLPVHARALPAPGPSTFTNAHKPGDPATAPRMSQDASTGFSSDFGADGVLCVALRAGWARCLFCRWRHRQNALAPPGCLCRKSGGSPGLAEQPRLLGAAARPTGSRSARESGPIARSATVERVDCTSAGWGSAVAQDYEQFQVANSRSTGMRSRGLLQPGR